MALKETKSPQEIINEMKAEERSRLAKAEIEMEGATIRGAMPTFKNLTKTIDYGMTGDSTPRRDLSHPTGQIFTLPNGNEVVLVPEAELPEFLFDDTVTGKDTNEVREYYPQRRRPEYDPSTYEEYVLKRRNDRLRRRRVSPRNEDEGVDARRVMVPEAAKALRKDRAFGVEGSFPVHHLGNGFFVLLGVEQQYQPDKSSFGTYEMTSDGPVRTDDGQPTTKSIPIVFYSDPNKPIEYEALDDYDKKTDTYSYVKDTRPSFGGYLLDPSRNYVRQGYRSVSDTQVPFYNVDKSKIKPELIPDFTGRDVIEGYKAAKAASRSTPPREVKPPRVMKPAPPPEPRPEPPPSFQGREVPVVDTLKGRRRKAKRRFAERQELTDE